ncbi:hypothetical protein PHACT_03405 [Pseudohongiella acticola]|jgi:hypothetical protein|uniref:Uncharacterized protein n=1 Tax=Pseudohongiella acticola TaxID=1524254 RepID=A0A1E8CJ26_9GAMM|nr:hypothetical protein [Pseudohongiella acticola]OFE12295.1 hypothetical protein PHACT_03405 [Pseudohongiella acticola]
MQKIMGIVFLVLSAICVIAAVLTAINLGFIMTRPDSISVANAFVGQFVVIVGALVLGRILYRAGRGRLGGSTGGSDN